MTTDNSQCCLRSDHFRDWIIPEGLVHNELGQFYKDYPVGSRLLFGPLAVITGAIKPILFPIMCAVGVVAMPIIALVQYARGEKKDAGEWLKAWVFCILGTAATFGLASVMTFYMPLIAMIGVFIGLVAISIVIHVYVLVKEPPPHYPTRL